MYELVTIIDDRFDVGYYFDLLNLIVTSNVKNYVSIEFITHKKRQKVVLYDA